MRPASAAALDAREVREVREVRDVRDARDARDARDVGLASRQGESRRFRAHERKVQVVVLCSAALVASCAAPANPAVGFDVDARAMNAPDCLSTVNPFSVGLLDVAQPFGVVSGYLALVDVPVPPAAASLDTIVETFSLERGAFADSSLRETHISRAPALSPANKALGFPFFIGLTGQPALVLVDSPTITRMASDPALTNILREDARMRLSIVAQLVGNVAPTCCEVCDCLAFVDRAPFAFQSAPFSVDIDLCNGCLASPTTCPDGSAPIPNPASCNPGQDVPAEVCP